MDNQNYLNSLPHDITKLNVSNIDLTSLDVRRFTNLQVLYCDHNQLSSLYFNENLEYLFCDHNHLASLYLNKNLKILSCNGNHLTSLHLNEELQCLFCSYNDLASLHLNENLQTIFYHNNPIYEIINSNNKDTIKQKMRILNNFRYSYYCLKFKKQFRDLLWVKIREPKIRKKYSHSYLLEHLYEDTDLDELLNNW